MPDGERFLGALGTLMHPSQLLKDLEQISSLRVSCDRPFEGRHRFLGLAEQQQGLSQVITRQCIIGQYFFCFSECVDGTGVFSAMSFEQPQQHPSRTVIRRSLDTIAQRLHEVVERAELDVMAIDTVQRRAAARILFEHGNETFRDLDLFLFVFGQFVQVRDLPERE